MKGKKHTRWILMQCIRKLVIKRAKAIVLSCSQFNRIICKLERAHLDPIVIWILALIMFQLVEEEKHQCKKILVLYKKISMELVMHLRWKKTKCHQVELRILNQPNQQLLGKETTTLLGFHLMLLITKVPILNSIGKNQEVCLQVELIHITYQITIWAVPAWMLKRVKTFSALFSPLLKN
jgi:hypothetical protein